MITQPPLDTFENIEPPYDWSGHAVSLSFNQTRIIRWIIDLYNAGQPFDLDPCYSEGKFWKGLPEPHDKSDLYPKLPNVYQEDARNLHYREHSLQSIMFDPPFIAKDVDREDASLGIIEERFSGYKSMAELLGFYIKSLQEFYRVLKPGGLLVFKCQDVISGGKPWWTHHLVIDAAEYGGFILEDLFVLGRNNVLWSPNMKNQKHARKNHCYFLVFIKEAR